MSFTDQKPRATTQEHIDAKWGGRKNSHWCDMCGHRFAIGEIWRWVYANNKESGVRSGNFVVCESCDGDDVLARRAAQEAEFFSDRFRSLRERYGI